MQTDSNNTPVDLKQHLQFTAWGLLLLMGVYLLLTDETAPSQF